MDLRRPRAGEWIAAVSGAALLVSLFLPWYTAGTDDATAWQALTATDVLLALAAAFAAALVPIAASQRTAAVPIAFSALVSLAGIIAVLLVLLGAANLPDGADGREWALWVALVAALGIAGGGWLAMRDERLSPPPPDIEPIPAPRPE
jgi:heme A synthase